MRWVTGAYTREMSMMNLTRRNFCRTAAGAASYALALTGCNATGLLEKIDAVTNAANAVLGTLDAALCPTGGTCIALPYVPLVDAWIAAIQGANTKALAIADGASVLTATQITDIVGVYAGALVFNFPGVPGAVTTVINAVVAAVDVLLSFLGATPTAIAAFRRGDLSAVPSLAPRLMTAIETNRGLFFKEHVRSSIKLNDDLGHHLAAQTDKMAGVKAASARDYRIPFQTMPGGYFKTAAVPTSGFGTGGYGN